MNEKKEYIEREALLDRLCGDDPSRMEDYYYNAIKDVPAADVVKVVRCKDCKHSGMYAFGCGDREHLACLEIEEDGFVRMATAVDDDDYCSYGERKEK